MDGFRDQRGFTLVETMVVVFLIPVIFLALYAAMDSAFVIYNTNTVFARLNQNAMQSLRYISREIGESSPLVSPDHLEIDADGDGNSIVTFQVPVDWDADGDVVTGTLDPDVEWGAYEILGSTNTAVLDGWIRYFVEDNQLKRIALDDNLAEIDGTETVIINDVSTFTANQVENTVILSLGLTSSDDIGLKGQVREFEWTFSSRTILRNAVS